MLMWLILNKYIRLLKWQQFEIKVQFYGRPGSGLFVASRRSFGFRSPDEVAGKRMFQLSVKKLDMHGDCS